MSSLLVVVNYYLFPALYNYSQFVYLNREKGEEAAVTSNGHTGERRCGSSLMSGKETRRWQSFSVGGLGTRERGEVAAVIRSGWACRRGEVAAVIPSG